VVFLPHNKVLTNPLFISDVIRFVLSLRSFHDQGLPVSDDFSSYYDMGDNSPPSPHVMFSDALEES
jgi:hypothetical protein